METPDQWRERMRHEQERRDDQRRQDHQRREDQRRRDDAERRRRSDEQARLAEEKRHNRAMEASIRDSSARRTDPPTRKRAAAASSNEPVRGPRRKGGFFKLIVLVALIWGAIHFWPEISGVAMDALASRHARPSSPAVDHATTPSASQADGPVSRTIAEPAPTPKPAVQRYPRCSASITDHCRQE